jgi:hypothetical protein
MSIYTKLTRQEIEDHLINYKLGTLTNFKEIIEGIKNLVKNEVGPYK